MTLFFQSNNISKEWERDQNSFRKNQRRKGQLGPIIDRYSNQEVSTLPKRMERDQ